MTIRCTIVGAETQITIKVIESKTATPLTTLKLDKMKFVRHHQRRFPLFIKELLIREQFSFSPKEIKNRGYREGEKYHRKFRFHYEDARTTSLQSHLRRVTRWKIIDTLIQVVYDDEKKETKITVEMSIMKSLKPTSRDEESVSIYGDELPIMEVRTL